MVEIILHGRFKTDYKDPIKVVASTVMEAMEAISRQIDTLRPNPKTGKARIKVVGYEDETSLYKDLEPDAVLHVVPQMNGGKSGNAFLQIAAGALLIGLSFIPGVGPMVASIAMKVGTMLVLGGLSQLLAPAPENDKGEKTASRYLGTPGNTVQIGTRISILYGEDRVYGHYISFDINAQQFSAAAQPPSGGK